MKSKSTIVMQAVRLIGMVLAVAGIIYAIEYVPRGIAVWFWVVLLGIGFVGLLYSFRVVRHRNQAVARQRNRTAARKSKSRKRR